MTLSRRRIQVNLNPFVIRGQPKYFTPAGRLEILEATSCHRDDLFVSELHIMAMSLSSPSGNRKDLVHISLKVFERASAVR